MLVSDLSCAPRKSSARLCDDDPTNHVPLEHTPHPLLTLGSSSSMQQSGGPCAPPAPSENARPCRPGAAAASRSHGPPGTVHAYERALSVWQALYMPGVRHVYRGRLEISRSSSTLAWRTEASQRWRRSAAQLICGGQRLLGNAQEHIASAEERRCCLKNTKSCGTKWTWDVFGTLLQIS